MGRRPLSVKPFQKVRYCTEITPSLWRGFFVHSQRCVQAGGRTSGLISGLTGELDVKAEMEHIAVNDFIVASFDT